MRKLDAVPVQMPTPEVREAAARGTIDGFLFPHSSILPYGLARTASAAATGANFGSFVITDMIGRRNWAALPKNVQAAMEAAGDWVTTYAGCKSADDAEAGGIAQVRAAGVTMGPLAPPEHAKLVDLMADVSADWAWSLDRRGKQGTAALDAFRAALKQ